MGQRLEVETLERPDQVQVLALPEAAASTEVPEIWSMRLSVLGAVLAVPAVAVLLARSLGSPTHVFSFAVYGVGVLSMFIASAVFHAEAGRPRTFSKCLDYGAIGLMIAGSFTPYCLIGVGTPFAKGILAVIWGLALGALILRVTRTELSKWIFVAVFLVMGWLGLLLFNPIRQSLGTGALALTVLGGVIYTAGTLFFNRLEGEIEPPGFGPHDIWHIFIIAAAGTHYLVYLLYMLPK